MHDILLKNGYSIKLLGNDNHTAVLDLCVRCKDYYELHCGILPEEREVKEIFEDLPTGKGYDDKIVLGVFDAENGLIGVLDIIRNYVTEGEWTIGLMILDPKERGKGLGRNIHNALIKWAEPLGAKSFRIGVIEENSNGFAFWSAIGYRKIKEVSMVLTEKTHIVNVMTLHLQPACHPNDTIC